MSRNYTVLLLMVAWGSAVSEWSHPINGKMTYLFGLDRSKIKAANDKCDVYWDEDDKIGSRMPDECCDAAMWAKDDHKVDNQQVVFMQDPETLFKDKAKPDETSTCYVRPADFPGFPNTTKMRLYLGCVDGHLEGAENCVPSGLKFTTKEQLMADDTETYTGEYPIGDADKAEQYWMDGTPDECGCSQKSRFNHGPGCYLAYATAYDWGTEVENAGDEDKQLKGAVYVKIEGYCENDLVAEAPLSQLPVKGTPPPTPAPAPAPAPTPDDDNFAAMMVPSTLVMLAIAMNWVA